MSTQTLDEAREAFTGRLFEAALGATDVLTVYVGDRLGLYRSLHEDGPATFGELADRTGMAPRYAREWLEQQAASGIVTVDDVSAAPEARRFTLPDAHAAPLVDPDSPFSIAPLARAIAGIAIKLPALLDAYRTGGGVSWEDFGPDAIESQGDFNRPWIRGSLGTEYLPSVPELDAILTKDGARVADIACGVGWASIAIAQAYPTVRVDGFDLDTSSIEIARKLVAEHGVADRVRFDARDCAEAAPGAFDLAIMIEALHDVSRPVEILSSIKASLAPGGVAVIADEKVGEEFVAPADDVERFMYAASILMCLPAGMAEQPSAATGTVIRPATLRRYATEAGFSSVEVLEQIDHPMLRFYLLRP